MGSNDDIMHEFVRKELKKLYPSVDGWQIRPAAKSGGKEQGFIVVRRILGKIDLLNMVIFIILEEKKNLVSE